MKTKTRKDYWLTEWKKKKVKERYERQQKFIEWLRERMTKDVWNEKIRRFVNNIDVRTEDECWDWLETVDSKGYGKYRYGRETLSHRICYILVYSEISKDKPHVLHDCDNPRCCNYHHLKTETNQDNVNYKVSQNRQYRPDSEKSVWSKLTWNDVNEIREMFKNGVSVNELAIYFKISYVHVRDIVRGNCWKNDDYQNWVDLNYDKIFRGLKSSGSSFAEHSWSEINKLRELWKTGKYTQRQLAKMFRMSFSAVSLILRNKRWFDKEYNIERSDEK